MRSHYDPGAPLPSQPNNEDIEREIMTKLYVSYRYYDGLGSSTPGEGFGNAILDDIGAPKTAQQVEVIVNSIKVPGARGVVKIIPLFWHELPGDKA